MEHKLSNDDYKGPHKSHCGSSSCWVPYAVSSEQKQDGSDERTDDDGLSEQKVDKGVWNKQGNKSVFFEIEDNESSYREH